MASAGGDWKDMYYAAERGDVDCVRFHLREGVDVNYQHPEAMMSALVISILNGHADVVRALLEHGADANLPAELGNITPLQAAQQQQRADLQRLLQQFGAHAPPVPSRTRFWRRWLPL